MKIFVHIDPVPLKGEKGGKGKKGGKETSDQKSVSIFEVAEKILKKKDYEDFCALTH